MKSKTLAVWLTLFAGPLGLHRWYLTGVFSVLMLLPCVPTGLGIYGIWRMRELGVDDPQSAILIPMLGLSVTYYSLSAIVLGLMSPEAWNQKYNPSESPTSVESATNWMTIAGLVLSLFLGATALLSTIAFSFQRLFEYQLAQKDINSVVPLLAPAKKTPN